MLVHLEARLNRVSLYLIKVENSLLWVSYAVFKRKTFGIDA